MKPIVSDMASVIQSISGSYTPYVVFTDWCKMYALAIANACEYVHGKLWQERENAFLNIQKKYTITQMSSFAKLGAMLVELYEEEGPYDALGELYMAADCGSKATGQFFTPFHISLLTAGLREYPEDEKVILNEPSCGAGGMILAVAKTIDIRGGNAQRQMRVVAQDLDWNAIYMTYIQLSLNGIDAICVQGDTLQALPFEEKRALRTPRNKGVLL